MNFLNTIKSWFNLAAKEMWVIVKIVFDIIKPMIFAGLREIFISAILEVKNDHTIISNEEKRVVAVNKIKKQLLSLGKELKDSSINFLLEAFITYLKNSKRI